MSAARSLEKCAIQARSVKAMLATRPNLFDRCSCLLLDKAKTSGEHVTVNGRRLYIKCDGEGLPVVILEAGLGANSASFTSVHSDVATSPRFALMIG
jgi:hypothetical protein